MTRVRPDVAYILPMAVFMALTWAGVQWTGFYPISYVLKSLIVAALLIAFWPSYTRIRWTHLGLGVAVGVIGIVQWIGMEKLLMSQPWLSWTRMIGNIRAEAYHPYDHLHGGWLWAFIAFRWAGASLVVPFMEERFWRDFLWRSIASPNNFELQEIGEYDRGAFWGVPLVFAAVHPQWLTAIVWALLIAALLWKTRSLGACIVAHATTNFLLGAYVLIAWYVFKKDEWYFW
ncbi:MAG: CAAX prenyl protease-related protein [Tepidisphaeraceae bacterium]